MGSPISRETFLERAQARFAAAYDYSEIVYKSYKTPVNIRCRIHPVKLISITPEKHLQTSGGCKFCLRQSRIRMLEGELHRDSVEGVSLGKALVERVMLSSGGSAGSSGPAEEQQAPLR
jgi:hypothetical protein